MCHSRITSKNVTWVFGGMLAVAISAMGSIAIVDVKAADASPTAPQGAVPPGVPMVRLPEVIVKGLTAKGIPNVALVDHDGGIKQVLALSSDGVAEVNMNPPEPSHTGSAGEVPETQPIVRLPPELVKGLTQRAIWNLALLDHSGGIKQVLALFPDGRCEACEKIQGQASQKVGVLSREGIKMLDFAIGAARAAHICPKDCICSSGNCRNKLGSCCPC